MRRGTICVGLATVASLAATVPATAATRVIRDYDAARSYWTPERMRAAEANAGGVAVASAARRSKPRHWHEFPAKAKLVDWDNAGVRAIGRIYSVRPDGTPNACSATVVKSHNESVVWTAGHCIHTGRRGGYHTKIVFMPGARAGATPSEQATPYGTWPAVRAATTPDWARSGDRSHFRRDFGVIVVGRDAAGRTISAALGGAHRIAFSPRRPRSISAYGYPGLGRFQGNTSLWACQRRGVGTYRWIRGRGPKVQIARCEMNAGSSGGPWITRIGRDGRGTVVSVISAGLGADGSMYGNTVYAPVQERVARRLFENVEQVAV